VLRKRLHLKAYKQSILQGIERLIVCMTLSVNVLVTLHRNIWNTIVKLFLKQPALPVEVVLKSNYPRSNSVYFATL
jgi:hypothetical protein